MKTKKILQLIISPPVQSIHSQEWPNDPNP